MPFTHAGCDVGAFSTANVEFENVFGDIDNVFGANSPEATEANSNFDKAVADFEGIAIHCALASKVRQRRLLHHRRQVRDGMQSARRVLRRAARVQLESLTTTRTMVG